ncbi:helix-turn-helix domain-containing protein [Niallia sp. JL1B1071]|uniref:helix-turn-helix domain-containing protein n=1 Tax=Niallia tiangongensis TaxID=3237105 RepID=UPI0037DD74D9
MYTVAEVCKKLGLDRQTVEGMCEKGKFQDAHKNENGFWLIPDYNFITSREQDERAEEVLRQIDRKNRGDRDENEISYIPAKLVSDHYGVTLEKVKKWIKEGYLSGKQVKEECFVPEEEFEYLKARRESDATEEEIKKFLGSDIVDWDFEIEE